MDKKASASLLPPLVLVIVLVSALMWVAGVAVPPKAAAASEPTFGIVPGEIAWLNMTVAQLTQVDGDDPTDSGYYIDVPLNITVENQDGTLLEGVTVIISGPHTNYENFTDATGTMTYMFNKTEITKGEEKIAVRASKPPQYPYAEKVIWVGYAGVLNMEQGNTAVDVLTASYGGSTMDIYFTSVVVDTAKASSPEAGVNVTAVITDVVNIDTNELYWKTDGDSGAQSGDSAFIPQSLITDEDGEATFGVHIEQENAGDVEITIEMTGTKESYLSTTSSSSITINANGNCFIATAAYGTPVNENLNTLRAFRDTILLTNPPGEFLVEAYYLTSPPVANALSQSDGLRAATRTGRTETSHSGTTELHWLWCVYHSCVYGYRLYTGRTWLRTADMCCCCSRFIAPHYPCGSCRLRT
jgi:hypothetical protein